LPVTTTATSLCPCSKEISEYGAHNQRSKIKITVKQNKKNNQTVWIEELIKIANNSASCKIYSVLKRTDEKEVTEIAYNNPVFVEDIVRSCSQQLSLLNILDYNVEVENQESIHLHEAYAKI